PDLQRVDLRLFDTSVGQLAISIPRRSEQRTAIVARPPHLMTEGEIPLLRAVVFQNFSRCRVDFPTSNARSKRVSSRLNRLIEYAERLDHLRRRAQLTVLQEIKRSLHVRCVVILADTEINCQQMSGFS